VAVLERGISFGAQLAYVKRHEETGMTRRQYGIRSFLGGIGIVLFASPSQANMQEVQISAGDLAGLVEAVHAEVVDNVVDGCWTNLPEVQAVIATVLAENDIDIMRLQQPSTAFHPALIVSVAGNRVNESYCLVQAEMTVSFIDSSSFADASANRDVYVFSFSGVNTIFRSNVALTSNSTVNVTVANWVEQTLTQFSNDAASKRNLPGIMEVREILGPRN